MRKGLIERLQVLAEIERLIRIRGLANEDNVDV